MLPNNIPKLKSSDLNENSLTGLFLSMETIFIEGFYIGVNTYVFLKNSMMHNEHGPAVIMMNQSPGSTMWYFQNNRHYLSNTPFSALNYSYPTSPSEIHLRVYPTWDGSQFVYNPIDITGYMFLNTKGELHCEHGPAHLWTNQKGEVVPGYWLSDQEHTPDGYQQELTKLAVLGIIKSS